MHLGLCAWSFGTNVMLSNLYRTLTLPSFSHFSTLNHTLNHFCAAAVLPFYIAAALLLAVRSFLVLLSSAPLFLVLLPSLPLPLPRALLKAPIPPLPAVPLPLLEVPLLSLLLIHLDPLSPRSV